jgi:2-polyprenyl-3-methyl-5-hydroxy-6-metoxy-1,4-benzoquinol methylase
MKNYKNDICINCGSKSLQRFLDLGNQPNGNRFPDPNSNEREAVFPFAMDVCTDCWQVQLEEFPSPEFLFRDHPYITGINAPVVAHFEKLSRHIIEKFQLEKNSLIIDIGCNDGTLLSSFADAEMRVLGVDPGAVTGALCKAKGINVCQSFWNISTGRALKDLNLLPRIVTATAVFYHIPDLHDFVDGLREVMDEDTVFVTQCVYLKDIIEKNQFDHFYHEHIMIHSLAPLKRLFESHGMRMFDVEFDPIHGGSFILYVCLSTGVHQTTKRMADALVQEENSRLNTIETFHDFANRVQKNRDDLVRLLQQIRAEGKRVFGLCAPVKGSTLLNYANIDQELVELTTEINPHKIGKMIPGTRIPIVDEKSIVEDPDYYLILSWNFLDYFIEKYAIFLDKGGKFIVPNPEVRIIDHERKSRRM